MKKLKDILVGFDFEVTQGDCDMPVKGLHFDSRLVTGGDVFFAIRVFWLMDMIIYKALLIRDVDV